MATPKILFECDDPLDADKSAKRQAPDSVFPPDVYQEIAKWCDAKTFRNLAVCGKVTGTRLCSSVVQADVKKRLAVRQESRVCSDVLFVQHVLPNGEQHGTEEWWNDEGVRTRLVHYEHDKQHGTAKWWSDAGVRTLLVHYEHGKQHGTMERYNDAGARTFLAHYEHDERHGTAEWWNNAGARTRLEHYEHGELHGTVEVWNHAGVRTRLAHYEHGQLVG